MFFLLAQDAIATSPNNIDKLLGEANESRSSDPVKYSFLLEELNSQHKSMSLQQNYYFDYLTAYQLIYNGKPKKATSKLITLLSSEASALTKLKARLTLVNIFAIEQNWSDGLSHLSTALKQLPKIKKNMDIKEKVLGMAAIFYNQLGQYSLGLKYAERLIITSTKNRVLCVASMNIIESKLYLKKLNTSNTEIQDAITLCKNEPIAVNFIRTYKAKYDLENNDASKVIVSLPSYLTQVEATKYPRLIVEIYAALAQAYLMQGNLKEASVLALKTITIGENIQTTQAVVSAYKTLYQLELIKKNHQKALDYHQKYSQLDKAYLDETTVKYLAFQLAEHQTFEQESQIELLNEKNNSLATEQALAKTQVANRQLVILLLIVIILVLAFIGTRFYRAHKRVKELAEYDPLTGIYNRGHFTHVTNSALKYCKNAQQDMSVIMFDLDHFKKVNDSFGHACGDWALKETIKVCQRIGRKNDIFARLGGEEFCLVLTSCTIDMAMLRAEACRAAIEEIITEESGHDFSITASFGVTDIKRSGFNLDKLLADADMAAYASKNTGRNRVTMFEVPQTDQAKKLDSSWNYN
ncbi:GGDEF domain-containing protein [Colwellia demingiae]|uniref:diguanylate cyclase n=1 Tax=Colwellia demingiae TaxID=89401 RepID=A0A5C6Q7M2_9GAMM|nr:GGDEF domain-containing protein [Colwellia demingiae]TWX64751.1 GGDEF domain-containing protein [Colwellia demingiae]